MSTNTMHLGLGHSPIPEKIAECSRNFQSAESAVRDLFRPTLKGVEHSKWERLHSHLLDILIGGNEIANRMEIYREIGRISFSEMRRLSHKIENHIEDTLIVKSILSKRTESEDQQRVLRHLQVESTALLEELKQLRHSLIK